MDYSWLENHRSFSFAELDRNTIFDEMATRQTADGFLSFIGLLPDIDPVLAALGEGPEILETLTKDPHLMSVIMKRKNGTLKKEFTWTAGAEPGKEPSRESLRLLEELEHDLRPIKKFDLVAEMLDAPLYGFQPVEILWEPEGSRLKIANLVAKPGRWFGYDDNNDPKFMSNMNPFQGEEIPFGKFVFVRHFPKYDNPYGIRLLSRCFWPVTAKVGGLKFWMNFIEKYGQPWVVAKHPGHWDKGRKAELLSAVVSMIRDAAAVINKEVELDFMQSKGKESSEVFEQIRQSMNLEISKVIEGSTLTAEIGSTGSLAAAQVHSDVAEDIRESDQKLLSQAFNEISRIFGEINAPGVPVPHFSFVELEDIQAERSARDKTLNEQGVKFSKSYYVRTYGFSDEDIEKVENTNRTTQTGQGSELSEHGCGCGCNEFQEGFETRPGRFTVDQQKVENFVLAMLPQGVASLEDNEKKIAGIVQVSGSFEQLLTKLLESFPQLDSGQLQDELEVTMTNTELFGRSSVTEAGVNA